jgi:hypothetical protein
LAVAHLGQFVFLSFKYTTLLIISWYPVKPNNAGALFAIYAVIGICGLILLPVSLELGVELTGAADASSAMFWGICNILTVMFILGGSVSTPRIYHASSFFLRTAEPALGAGPGGSPPYNLHNGIIFQACCICGVAATLIFFKGEQTRRKLDVLEMEITARTG